MRVQVLFFGQLKEIVGTDQESAELSEGARVEDLFERYGRRFPRLAEFRPSVVPSVNLEFASWRTALASGDEVAFLPPVSGGDHVIVSEDVIQLVRDPIHAQELIASVKSPQDGAVAVFEGTVRDHFRGRRTLYLEYEAYEPMALARLREIARRMRERFSIHRAAIVHRLGRVEIGDTSVLIAASAPHRGQALDACRFAIDTLKRSVPVWKKEFLADGAIWAEGERPSASMDEPPFCPPSESTS